MLVNINGSVRTASLKADGSFSVRLPVAGMQNIVSVTAVATNAAIGSVRLQVTFRGDRTMPEECKDKQIENTIVGTAGDDLLEGTNKNDLIWGLAGNDIIRSGEGSDCIVGGDGDDTIEAAAGDDVILGENGNDSINSGEGDDLSLGGTGDDSIKNPTGKDVILAGEGNDSVIGSGTIHGGPGDDIITADGGNSTIDGGPGNDQIESVFGSNNVIKGGEGDDRINMTPDCQGHVIDGGPGKDTLVLVGYRGTINPEGAPPPSNFRVIGHCYGNRLITDVRSVEAVQGEISGRFESRNARKGPRKALKFSAPSVILILKVIIDDGV